MNKQKLEKCSTSFLNRLYNNKTLIGVPHQLIADILAKRCTICESNYHTTNQHYKDIVCNNEMNRK